MCRDTAGPWAKKLAPNFLNQYAVGSGTRPHWQVLFLREKKCERLEVTNLQDEIRARLEEANVA